MRDGSSASGSVIGTRTQRQPDLQPGPARRHLTRLRITITRIEDYAAAGAAPLCFDRRARSGYPTTPAVA